MELLERDDIPAMVIVGETGCGKSTQVNLIRYFEILKQLRGKITCLAVLMSHPMSHPTYVISLDTCSFDLNI